MLLLPALHPAAPAQVGDGVFEVLSTSGDTHLGGDDFDKRIVDFMAEDFKRAEGLDLRKDRQVRTTTCRPDRRCSPSTLLGPLPCPQCCLVQPAAQLAPSALASAGARGADLAPAARRRCSG